MGKTVHDENVILKKLREFQSKGNHSDVTVIVGGVEYPCHGVVLAASSDYFDSLFNSAFQDNKAPEILSKEVGAVFEHVLSYMYTGRIEITLENAYGLLVASDYLVMKELKEHCVEFIRSNHEVEEAIKIYYFAASPSGDSEFAKIAIRNLALNFREIVKTDDFLNIEFELLELILEEYRVRGKRFCAYCGGLQPAYDRGDMWCCYECCNASAIDNNLFPELANWIMHKIAKRWKYLPELTKYFGEPSTENVKKMEAVISKYESQFCPSMFIKPSICLYTITEKQSLANFMWDNSDNYCWILHEKREVPFHRLKGSTIREKQYFLSLKSSGDSIENQFWVSHKQSQFDELPSPPVFSEKYAIAGINNSIFLYLFDETPIRNYETLSCVDFKAETGSNNMYVYVVDLNKWFTIPPIPKFVYNSYFVPANNMLFVIGGTTSYALDTDTNEKIMQCFDPLTFQWSEKLIDLDLTLQGKACSCGDKIFICEEINTKESPLPETRKVYIYDVTSDQWETVIGLEKKLASVDAVVVYDNSLWILSYEEHCSMLAYNMESKLWKEVPGIPSTVDFDGVDCEIKEILDALIV